jgi:hypothetical protein
MQDKSPVVGPLGGAARLRAAHYGEARRQGGASLLASEKLAVCFNLLKQYSLLFVDELDACRRLSRTVY